MVTIDVLKPSSMSVCKDFLKIFSVCYQEYFNVGKLILLHLKKKITYSDGYIKSLISPSTIGCFMPILSVRVHFSKMRPFSCGSKVLVDSWEDDTAKHIC